MKKIALVLAGLFMAGALFAADGFFMNAGVGLQYSPTFWGLNDTIEGVSETVTMNESIFSINAYADFYYARVIIGYGLNTADPTATASADGISATETETGVSDTFLSLTALGKYPFMLAKNICLWPAVGLEKVFLLSESVNGASQTISDGQQAIESPLYIKIGIGLDILAGNFVITPQIFYSYDLTPNPGSGDLYYSDATYSGYKFDFGVSFGYKF
jgi:hypothetical protein